MLDQLSDFLRPLPPHLRRLWRPDLGAQILFVHGKPCRIPSGGKTASPYFNDHDYHPRLTPQTVKAVGVNGWGWADQRSEFTTFDVDSIANHGDGLTDEQLAEIVGRLMDVPEAEIIRSKSGRGIHVRIFFDPQPRASRTPSTPATGRATGLACRADRPAAGGGGGCLREDRVGLASGHGPRWLRATEGGPLMLDLEQTPELSPESKITTAKANAKSASGWDETHRSIFATAEEAGYCVILTEHEGKPMAKLHICGLLVDWQEQAAWPHLDRFQGDQAARAERLRLPAARRRAAGVPLPRRSGNRDWERSQSGKTYIRYNVKSVIPIRQAIDQTVDESINALRDAESIHQRGGVLVEVTHDADKPKQCLHDEGGTRYRIITPPALMVQLSRLATYQKYDERKREWVDRVPPDNVVNGILSAPRFPGIPVATGVVSSPVLRADGTVAREPGYNPETGLYLALTDSFPPLMPVDEARELLCDVLSDFPFATPAHRSGAIANIVTLVARHAFPGSAPCFVYNAPRPRVGKGLLTDMEMMIAEGRRARDSIFQAGRTRCGSSSPLRLSAACPTCSSITSR